MTNETADSPETVLIMNPQSGSGDHAPTVRDRTTSLGYEIRETQRENHAIELAESAAREGAEEIVAVGGDGTLNEVVQGVTAAEALDSTTVGVVPVGTGNDFAGNIGITGIEEAFDVLQHGRRRRLDLGIADGRPFVNSCIVGITATASGETSAEMKSRYGVLAYVMATLQTVATFQGLHLSASLDDGTDSESVWEGEAAIVLVGNGRRFSMRGSEQANVEDGLLDIAIIEDASSVELLEDRIRERLFQEEGDHFTRILASSLELTVEEDEPVHFSLDGEMGEFKSVTLTTRRQVLEMPVGDTYDPQPRVD